MNRREKFESLLAYIADTPVSFAGVAIDDISEEDIQKEIKRAKAKQKNNPSLFSGDPDGFFTYDDPILAIAAYLYQGQSLMGDALGIAGEVGENLRNDSYWDWLQVAIHAYHSRNKKSYLTLMGMTPQEAVKIDKDVVRIAVTGDAGFSGQSQSNVLYKIRQRHQQHPFDLIVHLGDVYFSGHGKEFIDYLVAPFKAIGPRVLSLVGNHDLYFGGEGFISVLKALGQPGRYFSIETPHWRVACLDTALPAENLRRNWGLIDEGQMLWLDKQLEAADGKRTILMSHHFIISGWEKPSAALKRQLALRLDKVFSWYWGHEHVCATYDKEVLGCYGACVGNGSFLEVRQLPKRETQPEWYATGRCSCYEKKRDFWPHGYLELELHSRKVIETYHLETGEIRNRVLNA